MESVIFLLLSREFLLLLLEVEVEVEKKKKKKKKKRAAVDASTMIRRCPLSLRCVSTLASLPREKPRTAAWDIDAVELLSLEGNGRLDSALFGLHFFDGVSRFRAERE